jgi:hypothetical protein
MEEFHAPWGMDADILPVGLSVIMVLVCAT